MISFTGQTVVITGAAGGIARETARMMLAAGANLVLGDLSEAAVRATAESLGGDAGRVACVPLDVTRPADCERLFAEASARFGGVDHLVHAAGIFPKVLVQDMSLDQWRQCLAVNLDGSFLVCRASLPHLREGSSIVNIASISGQRGSHSHAHYAASKGGLISLTRSLSMELAPRTRVNCIAPGIIDTAMAVDLIATRGPGYRDQTPLGRHGRPEEVAGAICFLCSSLASFITGETLQVNGGINRS
ncbi:SDR family NAD(P)-dependent oxidoreductase [Piscinibacter sakaiensis]|uniref:3-oxoacyl-ACP reductase n=1 Tax=Piscinibacter sakaiensis TaxID=1547922 RepID=A0A0K8NYL8_PISS1|nr:SDR family NAD(P)-dependent oxidoreductase [Piscinibacter sakaiensis]GAP35394.1 3-oxoacyl-ACP reductase [Piscinibacter sakaiensis]